MRDGFIVIRNDAQNDTDRAALLKDVCPEASEAGDAVTDIDFRDLFKALLLPVGHHRERHVESVFLLQTRSIFDWMEFAADAHNGEGPHLEVEVRRVLTASNSE